MQQIATGKALRKFAFGRTLALTLVLVVQFFTSYVVRTYALVLVLGNQGIINRWLVGMGLIERPLPLLFHEAGVAIALILVPLLFMIFPIYSVLKNINPTLSRNPVPSGGYA